MTVDILDRRKTLGEMYALYSYTATNPDELSFALGELLKIESREAERIDDPWWRATNAKGEAGLVPSNYLGEYRASL